MSAMARVIVHARLVGNPALIASDSTKAFFHVLMSCIDATIYDGDADSVIALLFFVAIIRPVRFKKRLGTLFKVECEPSVSGRSCSVLHFEEHVVIKTPSSIIFS